ncbi:type II CRISPR RNA-guided endonuclease Cas9 [Segatella copri]|uniref:type II CRISPR RNA-guided endonuclease Cas9 n=2 Tax=Segatella copri TaxID=165179 RepID=UPI00293AC93D|nr:type II CRISPR RNA-guided endonuclease Cas9 [Segatella copri]MDV3106224.1 HNH endonuclease domain-containing protein [Segatella copri]WOF87140.1 HNH endonuclease domain-containing protein [Segatella copri]WOF93365.1 HNH endonuclease domain-containing protein [Segatella copri]
MTKILGIDTGTNSLGWAIVEKQADEYHLLDKGVNIFQEGVKIEKGIESSKAAERTAHKAARVRNYRIKLRKIRLLRILSDAHLCPPLSKAELSAWRLKKEYPKNELFMQWQSTDDESEKTPYAYRHKCLHECLDFNSMTDRYILGRAFYHIIQRRGFLSNRKDQSGDDTGKVKESISNLTQEMHDDGYEYLGDYFYSLYNKGEKIRNHYTARNEHYLAEFKAICEKQKLDENLGPEIVRQIEKAIFDQRPLKSQKGQVGKCVFEKNKTKCPSSHPMYEEFRMLSFINNIKIQTPNDSALRPLSAEEREIIMPLFFRKSKKQFDFEDIAKKLAPKKHYGFYKKSSDAEMPYLFNFPMDTSVSGCPVTAALKDIFGENWIDALFETYTLAEGKSRLDVVNDIWHALFFYTDETKLAEFGKNRLQLNDEEAKKFSEISLPSDYASLSLKAICKILPYLRRGLIYSHAVFLGNLCEMMPQYEWNIEEMRNAAIDNVIHEMNQIDSKDARTFEVCIKEYLKEQYHVSDEKLKKLYHPSMMEMYPRVQRTNNHGVYQLGSPRIDSVRNPMAMRSMFRLRKLVNRLLEEGKIDQDTEIHIEFARELNDANKRNAIAAYTKENQNKNDEARKKIRILFKAETGNDIEPTDVDVLKYVLWEEQGHICLYTGKQIRISDFVGANPKFDIEHTIPRSVGGDSTRMNLTLCDSRFNREIKKTKLPTELSEHDDIMARVNDWREKYESLDGQIRRQKKLSKGATTKDQKDALIRKRHLLELQRDYWRGKYLRFTMESVPDGFSRRQGTDISVISKYARLYLKSLFKHVYTVKGIATSDFRKIWGIQKVYSKKERVNHVHHCIDAIVIACIGLDEYNKLGAYYHDEENHEWYGMSKAYFKKPWSTFVEDVEKVQDEILVYHYTPDNMPKQGRRRILIDGKKVLSKGDAARGSLHNDTYYGAIESDGVVKYVKRINLASMKENDVKNIVDDTVRGIIEAAINEKGFKEAMSSTIWMNEEKQIPIKKVRCYTPSVTKPLNIRQQRDVSSKEYKQQYHVTNDSNYLLALYIGKDKKGKEKREFEIINMLQTAQYFKTSNDKVAVGKNIVPLKSEHDYPFAYSLKIGTMVLLYEKSPNEIWDASLMDNNKRLYKVVGLSAMRMKGRNVDYATIKLKHHEEARLSTELKAKNGAFKQGEELRPSIIMLHTQLNALVQGYDFEINELGKIKRLR